MTDREARHRLRMARKKATEVRGVLLLLTGNGKGKSSSAFGMAARALGHGLRVAVAQFIKGRSDTGEERFFRGQAGIAWHVLGEGFTWETRDRARDTAVARRGWAVAQGLLSDPANQLVILDELTYPLRYGYLDLETVLDDLRCRPPHQHVVVTGRGAPPVLKALADTVTELAVVRHAFQAGVRAQPGIDF
jgi:cob(I)alamin adenosyltransferase